MTYKALFEGLIFDELDKPVTTAYVGDEACYVVNDAGFLRHIPSEKVDRQILDMMTESIDGNEDIIAEQTSKMLGKDDLFSRAIIQNQLKNLDKQMENVLETGIPEEGDDGVFLLTGDLHCLEADGDGFREGIMAFDD